MQIKNHADSIQFLSGGGEMGRLIREKNWNETSLGPPELWPQSLRTTLSIILNSKFPMFLFWGEELICFYNDAYRPSLGNEGKHSSILGMKGENAWKEIWNIIKPLIDQVLAGQGATWSENQLIPIYRNGKIEDVFWTFSYSPVTDETGKHNGVFVTCIETTDMIIAQQKLQKEEKYHRMIEEVQDYAIILLDKDGIIENWNKGAEKIKGYTAEEIIGKRFSIFYSEEDRANQIPEKLIALAKESGIASDENWRIRKDGTKFWGSVVITAIYDSKKNITGFVKVTRDLTERKYAEEEIKAQSEELRANNIQLEKINKELKSFAYISSHDLQEPLRKIQTFSSLILKKDFYNLSEGGKDQFKRIQNAAERMQTLIDDLLAYSRTNTSEGKFEKTNLNVIVEEVRSDLKEEILQRRAIIETNKMCEVSIIPFQFRQLLINLISNSLKFSVPGRSPHIKIEAKVDSGKNLNNKKLTAGLKYCHLVVSDNGIGFNQEYSERIFELFQRLHGKDQYVGTGIGLAIVKKIVENHHGIISATSEINRGARFDIYFPVDNE